MSKKISRNFLVALLAVMTFFAAFLFLKPLNASAEEGAASDENGTFEMVEGASVTLGKDGLRYIVKMDQTVYDEVVTNDASDDVKLSFYIAPARVFEAVSGNYANLTDKTVVEVNENLIYKVGDYYYANAVYANVGQNNQQKLDFAAVAVITSQSGVRYASFVNDSLESNVRNMYEVLNAAALDSEEEYTAAILGENSPYSWFATEQYPLLIETIGDYDSLIKLVNAGKSFEGKYLYRNNELVLSEASEELDDDKTLPTIHADFEVKFLEADGSLIKTVKVASGGSISAAELEEIEPKDLDDKQFIGWEAVENVQENKTYTAAYKDVFTLTFKGADSAVVGTMKIAQGDNVTAAALEDLNDRVPSIADAKFIGWSDSDTGTSDISSDILANSVNASATYYAVYEHKVAYSVNVHVVNYNWELDGNGAGAVPERYRSAVMSGVIGYIREGAAGVYEQKNEQFADLIGTRKGYVGDAIDLSDFFASLNDCYLLNSEKTGDLSKVQISADATEVNIYLDWNKDVLGFAPEDIVYAGTWYSIGTMGLMRDPDTGIAGMGFVYDATVQQRGESRLLLKDGLTKTSYQGVIVKFSYKSTAEVRVDTCYADDPGVYTMVYARMDDAFKTYTYDALNDGKTDAVGSVAFCPQGAGRSCTLIIESVSYIESGSKTYGAADLKKLADYSYGKASWDAFNNAKDKTEIVDVDGASVLRYTTTGFDGYYNWVPLGLRFRFGNVDYAKYSAIIVKFKADKVVSWYECADKSDLNGDGYASWYDASEDVYTVNLLELTYTNSAGEYTLSGSSAYGFMIGSTVVKAKESMTLDIYSIEFVEKTAE